MDLSIKDYVLSNDYSLMMLFHFLPCLNCISLNYAYPLVLFLPDGNPGRAGPCEPALPETFLILLLSMSISDLS